MLIMETQVSKLTGRSASLSCVSTLICHLNCPKTLYALVLHIKECTWIFLRHEMCSISYVFNHGGHGC
jgi:hypothetical protein